MKTTAKAPATIDDYIAGFPPDVQTLLRKVRAAIRKAAPDATEAIKYQIPTFVLGRNLVHYGAFTNHIGFYPTASGIAAFEKQLKAFKSSRGAVQFPFDAPLPLGLIEKIVRFRVQELAKLSALGKERRKTSGSRATISSARRTK